MRRTTDSQADGAQGMAAPARSPRSSSRAGEPAGPRAGGGRAAVAPGSRPSSNRAVTAGSRPSSSRAVVAGSRPSSSRAVVAGSRPSSSRAAAAARLAGAPAEPDAVAARMRQAARRSAAASAATVMGSAALVLAPLRRSDPQPGPPGEDDRLRHLRVVRHPPRTAAQRQRRARAVLVASIAAATFIGLALVYLHVVLAQRQFAIDHLNSQLSQAQTTYQAERLQVAELSAPQHIISEAEGQLGMVQPSSVDYLTPAAGSSSPSPTVAQPLGDRDVPATVPASRAPTGDADWPVVKSQLAGQP